MTMRRTPAFVGLALAALLAGCSEGPSEIGFLIGSPAGVSYMTTLDSGDTIVVQGGASLLGTSGLTVSGDWVARRGSAHEVIATGWSWYLGVGGRLKITPGADNDNELGVRVPVGLVKNSAPAHDGLVIVELAPGFDFIGSRVTWDGGIGIRWPF